MKTNFVRAVKAQASTLTPPSAARRWKACPAQTAQTPQQTDMIAKEMRDGTKAHEMAGRLLK